MKAPACSVTNIVKEIENEAKENNQKLQVISKKFILLS
jgi:hypothetical protein